MAASRSWGTRVPGAPTIWRSAKKIYFADVEVSIASRSQFSKGIHHNGAVYLEWAGVDYGLHIGNIHINRDGPHDEVD